MSTADGAASRLETHAPSNGHAPSIAIVRAESDPFASLRKRLGDGAADFNLRALTHTRLPVLIMGETGTGKSVLARDIHDALCPAAPFVEINAAALPAPLFCSEMFGHERGAFTGAHSSKQGLVTAARGGILFLDEVAELSLESQAHLLCFLDTGRYRAVGSVRDASSDARVFAATNQDLAGAVSEGRFREDLYYRLASVMLPISPLRERIADMPALVRELLAQAADRYGVPPPELGEDAIEAMNAHPWPGNLRQLRFVLDRLAVAWPGQLLGANHVRRVLRPASAPRADHTPAPVLEIRPLVEMERQLVKLAMERTGGNRTKAAALLGITTRGLYNKLRRYSLSPGVVPLPNGR